MSLLAEPQARAVSEALAFNEDGLVPAIAAQQPA